MKETKEMESMSATELQIVETEAERVERWRVEALENAGYDAESAGQLAARSDVDLHQAVELLQGGCPAELALRILL
jgi:hypothetical protein